VAAVPRLRRLAAPLVLAAMGVALWGAGLFPGAPATGPAPSFDPASWLPEAWEVALGGDPAGPGAEVAPVLAWAGEFDATTVGHLTALADEVARAELSGVHADDLAPYFATHHALAGVDAPPPDEAPPGGPPPPRPDSRHCRDIVIRGVAGTGLPVGDAVKLAVIWQAQCPFTPPGVRAGTVVESISFLYAQPTGAFDPLGARWGGWVPVHPITLAGAATAARGRGSVATSWELEPLGECAADGETARGEVVAAWQALCDEATRAGVGLLAIEGWRSPQQQARLWREAVRRWGVDEARRRIAFSDGQHCESRHCSGEAIDVAPEPTVLAWLREPVGCLVDGTYVAGPEGCAGLVVQRVARYGFAFTSASSVGHLDYLAGTRDLDSQLYGDCTPGPVSVPDLVHLVFLCRTLEAGITLDEAQQVARQAVAVARCISAFDPAALSQSGRRASASEPSTGVRSDRVGVFGLSAAVADNHVVGGAPARGETWANVDGAARLYVHERTWGRWGWDPFPCTGIGEADGVPVLSDEADRAVSD